MESNAVSALANRLVKLQNRVTALRDVVGMGIPPEMDQILACEAVIEEVQLERTLLSTQFLDANSATSNSTAAGRKLAKDFARYAPTITDVLTAGNQACFEARMCLQQVEDSREEEQAEAVTSASAAPLLQQQELEQHQVQAQALDDPLLREIEIKAQSVRALNEDVAQLVAVQADDVQQVHASNTQARDDVVYGLGELAELKKREAGKHTVRGLTTSAVIGGSVGLIAGPFGVAIGLTAGAVVGSLLGSTVANISRRNIDREVRAFKEKFKLSETAEGYLSCRAVVYENEYWSFSARAWVSPDTMGGEGDSLVFLQRAKWTADELGTPLLAGKHEPGPMNPHCAPRAPLIRTLRENIGDLEEEDLPPGVWRWEPGSVWTPDIGGEDADTGGWRYAYSFAEGSIWTAHATRTSLVRRRCWVRNQILIPQRLVDKQKQKQQQQQASPRPVVVKGAEDSSALSNAIAQMDHSLRTSEDVLEELKVQGKRLGESARDVAIMEDASLFASRVSRAVTLSGVIRNTLSSRPDTLEQQQQHHHVSVPHHYHVPPPPPPAPVQAKAESISQIDHLQRLCEVQLAVSKSVQSEVLHQNAEIDALLDASERSTRRVQMAKEMI